jgi:general stress protein 26
MTQTRDGNIATLNKLIKGIEVVMLSTCESDGTIHSRPMATQKTDFDGDLWFFTRAASHKVEEIEREHHVNVSYADPSNQRYISVSGLARLVRDRSRFDELWDPSYSTWFPQGKDDADLALLRVTVQRAEYWEGASSNVINFG